MSRGLPTIDVIDLQYQCHSGEPLTYSLIFSPEKKLYCSLEALEKDKQVNVLISLSGHPFYLVDP